MHIHFIAIGGSAMHNLALALHDQGHVITGSDDEIYEPSRSRLEKAGILPQSFGWYTDKIEPNIDAIILGMHARVDNPELLEAQRQGLKIYSYPEFIAEQSHGKQRIVIAGSHGKTTTTSIIMHALSRSNRDYDYLVGAQLQGFDRMVKLSDADIIILEGDEYLSSPIDRQPKMMHYNPDIAVITGIAWDHINVFPTFADYLLQFRNFIKNMKSDSLLFYYEKDEALNNIIEAENPICDCQGYDQIHLDQNNNFLVDDHPYPIRLIGNHNMQNIRAAEFVCLQLGLDRHAFYKSLESFTGANKRLQILRNGSQGSGFIYLDFAHAPSKVKATSDAVKDWYPDAELITVFELHTYSSLNQDFIPQYKEALAASDQAIVFFSEHALKMKKMPHLEADFIAKSFDHPNIKVFSNRNSLQQYLTGLELTNCNLLLMTSGTFDGMDFKQFS